MTETQTPQVEITDPKLLKQMKDIESIDLPLRQMMLRRLCNEQIKINEKEARRSKMTPVEKRRDIAREEIFRDEIDKEDIKYIHSVLGLCGLPYKKLGNDKLSYEREYGFMKLNVDAGKLLDPHTGKWVQQGLPYGTRARLLQLHICSLAIQQKSPVIEMEDSMSAFMRSMGISVTGGKNGSIIQFKEQLSRLAACRMQIGFWNGLDRSITIDSKPISRFDVWFPKDPDQKMLWSSQVTLSQEFFDSLQKHALPIDSRSLAAVSNSARQMDVLIWLSYRTKGLKNPYLLTWDLLKEQFCQSDTMRTRDFRKEFAEDMQDIEEIFDKKLPIVLTENGALLKPCDPEKLFVPPKDKVHKRK